MKLVQNQPLYTIGVVSELLDVHPETIRLWEKHGVVRPPQRRSGKRLFSDNDLKRLQFVRRLVGEGLTTRAIIYYLRLYPCWQTDDCIGCIHGSDKISGVKPCWQDVDTYCQEAGNEDPCVNCHIRHKKEQRETTSPETLPTQQERGAPAPKLHMMVSSHERL